MLTKTKKAHLLRPTTNFKVRLATAINADRTLKNLTLDDVLAGLNDMTPAEMHRLRLFNDKLTNGTTQRWMVHPLLPDHYAGVAKDSNGSGGAVTALFDIATRERQTENDWTPGACTPAAALAQPSRPVEIEEPADLPPAELKAWWAEQATKFEMYSNMTNLVVDQRAYYREAVLVAKETLTHLAEEEAATLRAQLQDKTSPAEDDEAEVDTDLEPTGWQEQFKAVQEELRKLKLRVRSLEDQLNG